MGDRLEVSSYRYWFSGDYVAADGSGVYATEQLDADSWATATAERQFTDDQLTALATDPAMTFPTRWMSLRRRTRAESGPVHDQGHDVGH